MCSILAGFRGSSSPFCDYDEIEPGLYLGNWDAAASEQIRDDLKITHILTAYYFPINAPENIKTLFINVDDCPDADLLTYFDDSNEFIKDGQENGACMVHCMAGISRSSTLVIAFFMNKYNIGFKEARHRVEQKRYIISPNSGFIDQLQLYEAMGCKLDPSNIRYRIYLLQEMARKILKDFNFSRVESYANLAKSRTSGDDFKCRQCRQYLFSEANLVPHISGKSFSWRNEEISHDSRCSNPSLFVEALPWINEALTSVHGKIYCPKCRAKLGTFNWSGQVCSCNITIEPCFRVTDSSVDRDKKVVLPN